MSYKDTMEKNLEQDSKLAISELPSLEELLKRDSNVVIPELYCMVKILLGRVEELEKEVRQLKSRLTMDSHNSSKPPSSDGLKKKIKNLRQPSQNPTGGQNGHEGKWLKFVEKPDETKVHDVETCENCNCSLNELIQVQVEKAHVFAIPKPKLFVREHQVPVKICPRCGAENKSSFPPGVFPGTQYDESVKSFLVYLNQYQYLPSERACELFQDLFGHTISEGTLNNAVGNCSSSLEPFEKEVKSQIIDSPVIHCDETGMASMEKCNYVHIASTPSLTFYTISQKRGSDGMDGAGILPYFRGTAVHDFWGAYMKYPCNHAFCNAHIVRELIFAHEEDNCEFAKRMIDCILEIKEAVDNEKEREGESLPVEAIAQFEEDYNQIIEEWLATYPPEPNRTPGKRGRKRQSKTKNLLDRLSTYSRQILAFMYDFSIPFDNNLAERDLRMMKLKQKISGTFRSIEGIKAFCRIRSYISTVRKQGRNVLESLKEALAGKPFLPISP